MDSPEFVRLARLPVTWSVLAKEEWWVCLADPGPGRKHRRVGWKKLRARFLRYDGKTWVREGEVELFDPAAVPVTRYRYRGSKIPTPWSPAEDTPAA